MSSFFLEVRLKQGRCACYRGVTAAINLNRDGTGRQWSLVLFFKHPKEGFTVVALRLTAISFPPSRSSRRSNSSFYGQVLTVSEGRFVRQDHVAACSGCASLAVRALDHTTTARLYVLI